MQKIIFLLLLLPFLTIGQTIKNLPELFWSPISYDNQKERDKFATQVSVSKKGVLWLIAGDRDNITLLGKPNGNPSGQYLKFKETAFVIDENKEWIKIGVGPMEDNKFRNLIKAGWVKKKDLLLWPHALRNKDTYIRNIVFTGVKLSNLSDEYKDFSKIKVFDSPSSSFVNMDIYHNIYYIYKEEQGRVLLGTTDYFNQTSAKDVLVGWVDTAYIQRWNSRLTLECNWEDPSYSLRQSDSLKRIYGFFNPISADLYSKSGSLNKAQIVWDHDPAKSDYPKALRSDENNRRPIGDVFRFPVFDMTTGYIKSSGLIKIDNDKMETEPIKSHISKLSEATQSRILQEKPRVIVPMYLPLSIPGVEHPYKYVNVNNG